MSHRLAAALAFAFVFAAAPAAAQDLDSIAAATPTQAISFLPIHVVFGFFGGDYERAVSATTTFGLGASYFSLGDDDEFDYASVEGKMRYYPSGDVLNGMSFGVTVGPTFLSGDGGEEDVTAIGIGFEIARSHLMGRDRHFYYGYGAGLKRLFTSSSTEDSDAPYVLPSARLSVGYAF